MTTKKISATMAKKLKGYDEDGLKRRFQRVGGWCEPITSFQKLITSEPKPKSESK